MRLYTIGRKDDKISSLMQINKELLEEDDFKDVTLVSDDLHVVKAHKALLSKSSDVFRQMLMLKNDKNPIIFIRGSSQNQLRSILNFIYLGETEITEEDMNSFLQLAKDFKLKEFTDTKTKKKFCGTTENQNIEIKTEPNKNERDIAFELADEAPEDGDIHKNSDSYDPLLPETNITDEVSHERNCKVKCTNADCNKEFTQFQNMRVHYKVAHEGFAVKCGLCGYKTTRANIMRKHKQNSH